MKTLLTLAALYLSVSAAQAQQVVAVKDFLSTQKTAKAVQALNANSGSSISVQSLLFDVHPSIVFQNNQKTVTGNTAAVVLTTDVVSLPKLASMADRPTKVEVLEIVLDSRKDVQSAVVTPAMLDNLSGVKYIYFKSQVPCTAADIQKLVPATLTGITVLYDVQQPS